MLLYLIHTFHYLVVFFCSFLSIIVFFSSIGFYINHFTKRGRSFNIYILLSILFLSGAYSIGFFFCSTYIERYQDIEKYKPVFEKYEGTKKMLHTILIDDKITEFEYQKIFFTLEKIKLEEASIVNDYNITEEQKIVNKLQKEDK